MAVSTCQKYLYALMCYLQFCETMVFTMSTHLILTMVMTSSIRVR